MIFLTLWFIPLIIAILSFIIFKGISFKEFLLQVFISILISIGSAAIVYYQSVSYTENINSYVSSKYSQRVHCRHSYQCHCYTSCSGSGKHRSCSRRCSTCYEHSFDIDWIIKANSGKTFDINTIDRQGLIMPIFWNNASIKDPVSYGNIYVNYLKASQGSLFKNESQYNEFKNYMPSYPLDYYQYYNLNRIINYTNYQLKQEDQKYLSIKNSEIGEAKQVNMILVIVPNLSKEYIYALDSHWKGGNKNDVILIISLDGNKISWSHALYLSKSSSLGINIRDSFLNKDFDIKNVIDTLTKNVQDNYIRQDMKTYEYLKYSIVPSRTTFIVTLILNMICSFGMAFYFHNESVFGDE